MITGILPAAYPGILSLKNLRLSKSHSHARDMYGNGHSQGTCVLLEIPSMHKLRSKLSESISGAEINLTV